MIKRAAPVRHSIVSRINRAQRRPRSEAGYTLVELLIYSSLLVLILTVVGGMFINTLASEQRVLDSADANTVSQLISDSVHSGVRNATALSLTQYPDTDNQLLVLKTSDSRSESAADRICQAWYYTESNGGAMYFKRFSAGVTVLTALTVSDEMDGWMLMGQGLALLSEQPIFATNSSVGPVNIALNFTINKGTTSSPVSISTTVMSRVDAMELKCL